MTIFLPSTRGLGIPRSGLYVPMEICVVQALPPEPPLISNTWEVHFTIPHQYVVFVRQAKRSVYGADAVGYTQYRDVAKKRDEQSNSPSGELDVNNIWIFLPFILLHPHLVHVSDASGSRSYDILF